MASMLPSPWSYVQNVVGVQHHTLVMLYHYDRVAQVSEGLERMDQAYVIPLVQANAWLVHDV